MAEPSIFTRIINGEIPCHRVYEDQHVLAFLDINPLAPGHTLIVPKRQTERIDQLDPDEAAAVGRVLPDLGRRVMQVTQCAGYNILQNNGRASGQEVPHVHFHIIPRRSGDDLGFRWKPQQVPQDKLAALAEKIRSSA